MRNGRRHEHRHCDCADRACRISPQYHRDRFRGPALQARRDAKKVLETYREPLLDASYELQAKLYNILQLKFVERYISDDTAGKRDSAIESTLYVFAQFFGWREIIRREVQYLRFSRDRHTREIGHLLQDIVETFLSDKYGSQFMIWQGRATRAR